MHNATSYYSNLHNTAFLFLDAVHVDYVIAAALEDGLPDYWINNDFEGEFDPHGAYDGNPFLTLLV